MHIAVAVAAEEWTPVALIALVGVISTAVVGLAGFGVQLGLARRAAANQQRRSRYEEITQAYAEVGRVLSTGTYQLNRLFNFLPNGKLDKRGTMLTVAKLRDEIENYALADEPRHQMKMLHFHKAAPVVLDAVKAWYSAVESQPSKNMADAKVKPWWDAKLKSVDDALKAYYEAAGIDARSALDGERN